MAMLIKDRRIVADSWQRLERGADGSLSALPEPGDFIVPLASLPVTLNVTGPIGSPSANCAKLSERHGLSSVPSSFWPLSTSLSDG